MVSIYSASCYGSTCSATSSTTVPSYRTHVRAHERRSQCSGPVDVARLSRPYTNHVRLSKAPPTRRTRGQFSEVTRAAPRITQRFDLSGNQSKCEATFCCDLLGSFICFSVVPPRRCTHSGRPTSTCGCLCSRHPRPRCSHNSRKRGGTAATLS
jgi:hypothetical protein